MEMQKLEQLGEKLRHLGHRRREVVEQIASKLNEGDHRASIHLYQELNDISSKAISLMQEQKDWIDEEIRKQ